LFNKSNFPRTISLLSNKARFKCFGWELIAGLRPKQPWVKIVTIKFSVKQPYLKRKHRNGGARKNSDIFPKCSEKTALNEKLLRHYRPSIRSRLFFSLTAIKTIFLHLVRNPTLFLPRQTSINTNSKIFRLQV